MHFCRSARAIVCIAICFNPALATEFEITVTGGDADTRNVVVKLPIESDDIDSTNFAISAEGFNVMGQITAPSVLSADGKAELCFVLPQLEANEETRLFAKSVTAEEVINSFHFDDNPGKFSELSVGDRPVMRYMYEALDTSSPERVGETYKIFHHVYDPAGKRFVTKGPGGLFPHHRGLFFGFNRISYGAKKADIWHCRNGEHQAHRELISEDVGPVLGRHQLAIDWHGQDNKVFAEEQRELTAYNVEGGTLIEFATVLSSQVGKVRLDGDPQHAGFQFRGAQDIPDKTKHLTYYVRPDGKGEPGKFRNWSANTKAESEENLKHINLPWLALSFVIDEQRYTCCYLDHPSNPKPARFSERDYGRFGSYFEYDLDTDHPLKLNYRIWLQKGEMTVDEVSQISQGFVWPAKVALAK